MPQWDNYWQALNGGDISPDFFMQKRIRQMKGLRETGGNDSIKLEWIRRLNRETQQLTAFFEHKIGLYLKDQCEIISLDVNYDFEYDLFEMLLIRITSPSSPKRTWVVVEDFFREREISILRHNGHEFFAFDLLFFHIKTIIPELRASIIY